MTTLEELQHHVQTFIDERDWSQFHNYKDIAISLLLESSELLEHFQWKTPEEVEKYVITNKQDVAEEVIDVLYRVLLISNKLNINIAEEFRKKLHRNDEKYPVEKAKGRSDKYTSYIE